MLIVVALSTVPFEKPHYGGSMTDFLVPSRPMSRRTNRANATSEDGLDSAARSAACALWYSVTTPPGRAILNRNGAHAAAECQAAHGVKGPIWGYCTDQTTRELGTTPIQRARGFAEPRIEPEIMFGLSKAPSPNMAKPALLDCIDWIALGYEIVQSIYPGWNSRPRTDRGQRVARRAPCRKPPCDRAAEGSLATRTRQL